ncbi:MAG TPA: ATP-binding protein [Thermoanaerobaculia bacterium]|nr:ATP-binding protein [Thermoanaerobaculia bacterium]
MTEAFSPSERPAALRYGAAFLLVLLAVLIRWPLQPLLGMSTPFLFFFPAIMAASWWGGLGPGLLATALSSLAANFFFMAPVSSFSLSGFSALVQILLFAGIGVLINLLNDRLQKSRVRAEASSTESLRQAQELRRVQVGARESETRFRIMADTAPVLIWMAGRDRRRDWFNKQWLDFRGRPMEQELGDGWVEGIHPEDRDRYLEAYNSAFEARRKFSMEYRLRRHDGEYQWILANGIPRFGPGDSGDTFEGFIGTCFDITARRNVEQELRRVLKSQEEDRKELRVMNRIGQTLLAELDLERLVQAITDEATAVTHAQFGSFFYNVIRPGQEAYTLYALSGVPREAFAGFPMPRNTKVFGPTFNGEGLVRSDDITQDPRYGKNAPYHGMPEGHLPVRSYLAAPVVSRSGEVLGGLFFGHSETGIFTEREERILGGIATQAAVAIDNVNLYRQMREAREEAEAANRSKDEFLATVSHELRTPLNAILGWGQLLLSDGNDPEKGRRGLETIVRNARLQGQLIDDLLDVSRIISGQMRLDVRPLELVPVIDAAIEAVRPAAEARQIRLRRVLDPLAGPVAGDPARLQQVVWNLLSNAVKFTPKGGRMEVRLERVNSHVEIIVADNGAGISPDFLPQVFERFRQRDASTTRRHSGLGLGLAIVRHLVELHGGGVRVQSPGEGQGSTFVVTLPLSVAHVKTADGNRIHPRAEMAGIAACQEDPALNLKGIRVLVVDDEPDARETLQQILEHCDAEVLAVGSAREGLEALESWRPHVLLSDIGMPGEDGYSLIRQVRDLPADRGGCTPAAALTAFARSEDRRRALQAGFQLHVAKPVEVQELATVVANLARGTARNGTPPSESLRMDGKVS